MKKLISILLVFVMVLSMFTACGAGANGKDGKDGVDGADGISPQVKIGDNNYWQISYDSGATWQSLGVKATGTDGIDGEPGEPGEQGDTGAAGQKGAKGDNGETNYIWVKYADYMPTSDADLKDEISNFMGLYNGESKDAPTDYTAYQWIQIVSDAPAPVEEDFTVLAIGSSYLNMENAMTHIYDMAASVGYTNIKLGNIYEGGVKMSKNYNSLKNNTATYNYYENDSGTWVKTHDKSYSINAALEERDWDYIIINQGLIQAGLVDEYSRLEDYLALIREYCPNAKIFFSMSWAYPEGSTEAAFPQYYQSSQQVMFDMILDVVKTRVLPQGIALSPTGTAVMNARASGIHEALITYDQLGHLRWPFGRYLASLALFCAITGMDPADVPYVPTRKNTALSQIDPSLPTTVTPELQQLAIECVRNALHNPFEIIKSSAT